MSHLTGLIDSMLKEVLSQLAKHYPQSSSMTGSARMKEVIPNINISQDGHGDLIFTSIIIISKYLDGT
jgi:hypothetical protein